jgi:signal transduction histidine kinase
MRAKHRALASIRARTTAAFALFFSLLLLFAGSSLAYYVRRDVEGDADRSIGEIALRMRTRFEHGRDRDWDRDSIADRLIAEEEHVSGERLWMAIVGRDGETLLKSEHAPDRVLEPDPNMWRLARAEMRNGTILIGMDWRKDSARLHLLSGGIVLLCVAMLAAASIGAWWLVGRTLKPIQDLALQAHTEAAAPEHVRLSAPSDDAEMVGLVETLNELLGRIDEVSRARGRFYAAASHELRTPLQALSGHLELAESRERSAEEYKMLLAEARVQTARLVSLTRDLLVLNQLEAAARGAFPEDSVLLADPLERICSAGEQLPGYRINQIRLNIENCTELVIKAPSTHVEMVVRNLVENAVKFAEPGSDVIVTLAQQEEFPVLTVYNRCTPPAGWNPDRVFEAFYRPDASRSIATGGNGLGLAICKAVCDLNGWKISVLPQSHGVIATVNFGH